MKLGQRIDSIIPTRAPDVVRRGALPAYLGDSTSYTLELFDSDRKGDADVLVIRGPKTTSVHTANRKKETLVSAFDTKTKVGEFGHDGLVDKVISVDTAERTTRVEDDKHVFTRRPWREGDPALRFRSTATTQYTYGRDENGRLLVNALTHDLPFTQTATLAGLPGFPGVLVRTLLQGYLASRNERSELPNASRRCKG